MGESLSSDPAAGPVISAMRSGKWRKARDIAKDLCKRDRAKYLSLLVEANAGLAGEMIGRGLLSDARTVVDYLKTIAPAEVVTALEKELAAGRPPTHSSEPGASSGSALHRLWPELVRIAARPVEALEPAEITVIDDVVTAFFPPPSADGDAVSRQLATELEAVQAGCEAAAEGRWDDMAGALRLISSQSVFRHWRLFLRGMRLAFCGDGGEARKCFERLPPGSACAIAAASMPGVNGRGGVRPAALAQWNLALCGEPQEWAAGIAAADAAWKKGDWMSAHEHLKKSLAGDFPDFGQGVATALTDALFFIEPLRDPRTRQLREGRLRFWDRICRMERAPAKLLVTMLRAFLPAEEHDMPPKVLASEVGQLLHSESQLHGANPIRDSQGWQWLGEKLVRVEGPPRWGRQTPVLRDAAGAVRAFEAATKSDPGNEAAWLGLLGVHESQNATAKRNRLLDDLVKRFPQNKNVLLRAGAMAVARKAFSKGLGMLEKARALDPLDPQVRTQILVGLVLRVRDAHETGKETAGIWEQIEPMLDASPRCADLMVCKWVMRLRRALWDPGQAAACRDEAMRLAPSPREFLTMEHLFCGCYGLPLREDWAADWAAAGPSTWEQIGGVLRCILFAEQIGSSKTRRPGHVIELLNQAMDSGAKAGIYTGDPAGALAVLDQLAGLKKSPAVNLRTVGDAAMNHMERQVRTLPKKVVKGSLALECLELSLEGLSSSFTVPVKTVKRLKAFIDRAGKAGERELADRGRKLLERAAIDDGPGDVDDDISVEGFDPSAIREMINSIMGSRRGGPRGAMKKSPRKPRKKPASKTPSPPPKKPPGVQPEFEF